MWRSPEEQRDGAFEAVLVDDSNYLFSL